VNRSFKMAEFDQVKKKAEIAHKRVGAIKRGTGSRFANLGLGLSGLCHLVTLSLLESASRISFIYYYKYCSIYYTTVGGEW
jgi:hypothetical protein